MNIAGRIGDDDGLSEGGFEVRCESVIILLLCNVPPTFICQIHAVGKLHIADITEVKNL